MPTSIRQELHRLRETANQGQSGKHYYATSAQTLGVCEDEAAYLKFEDQT